MTRMKVRVEEDEDRGDEGSKTMRVRIEKDESDDRGDEGQGEDRRGWE